MNRPNIALLQSCCGLKTGAVNNATIALCDYTLDLEAQLAQAREVVNAVEKYLMNLACWNTFAHRGEEMECDGCDVRVMCRYFNSFKKNNG